LFLYRYSVIYITFQEHIDFTIRKRWTEMISAAKILKNISQNILVVDDEPSFRNIMKRVLVNDGHNVTLAEDGFEGLRQLKNKSFDIVLTDINMPNMDGWEFLKNVDILYPELTTAVITGLSSSERIPQDPSLSPKKIMQKPMSTKKIRKLIRDLT